MSRKEQSLSSSPMFTHCLNVITFVFCFSPQMHIGNPSPWAQELGGGFHNSGPSHLSCHWLLQNQHQFKTRRHFLPSLYTAPFKKEPPSGPDGQIGCVCVRLWEITSVVFRMPAYATNMRLKFPIVALTLEIITIILFAVFAVYDDGTSHGHGMPSNSTHHEESPMDLYPSKSDCMGLHAVGMLCYQTFPSAS